LVVANGSATGATGGGIRNSGTLTLINTTVSGNSASLTGGGIFNAAGGLATVTNSTVSGNSAGVEGGGIFNGGALTMVSSTISGNTAGGGAGGGGIRNLVSLTVIGSTITGNTATIGGGSASGGGISNQDNGVVVLIGTIVANNSGSNCLASTGDIVSLGYNLASDLSCNLAGDWRSAQQRQRKPGAPGQQRRSHSDARIAVR
jgi:hypothetical protein